MGGVFPLAGGRCAVSIRSNTEGMLSRNFPSTARANIGLKITLWRCLANVVDCLPTCSSRGRLKILIECEQLCCSMLLREEDRKLTSFTVLFRLAEITSNFVCREESNFTTSVTEAERS